MVFWGGLAACVTSLGLMLGVGPIETSALGAIPEIALTLALFFTICAAEARV